MTVNQIRASLAELRTTSRARWLAAKTDEQLQYWLGYHEAIVEAIRIVDGADGSDDSSRE